MFENHKYAIKKLKPKGSWCHFQYPSSTFGFPNTLMLGNYFWKLPLVFFFCKNFGNQITFDASYLKFSKIKEPLVLMLSKSLKNPIVCRPINFKPMVIYQNHFSCFWKPWPNIWQLVFYKIPWLDILEGNTKNHQLLVIRCHIFYSCPNIGFYWVFFHDD